MRFLDFTLSFLWHRGILMFRQPSVPLILYVKSEASEEALCSALGGGGLLPGHASNINHSSKGTRFYTWKPMMLLCRWFRFISRELSYAVGSALTCLVNGKRKNKENEPTKMSLWAKESSTVGVSHLCFLSLTLSDIKSLFFQGHILDSLEWQQNLNLANSDKIVSERDRDR